MSINITFTSIDCSKYLTSAYILFAHKQSKILLLKDSDVMSNINLNETFRNRCENTRQHDIPTSKEMD